MELIFFIKLKLYFPEKMYGYSQLPSWILKALAKFYFLRIVLNRAKTSLY